MKKALLVLGIVVGVLVLSIAGFGLFIYLGSEKEMARSYDIDVPDLTIPSDSLSLAEGKHLAVTRGCMECHGQDLGGGRPEEMGPLGTFYASNLTRGEGGVADEYDTDDWIRAIRHGVGPDGKSLMMMPSEDYYYLGEEDLAKLIAYIESVPPVDRERPASEIGPVGRMLVKMGKMPLLVPARMIEHDVPPPEAPPEGVTVAYGDYLSKTCIGCHGRDLSGGIETAPGVPPSSNLTPAGIGHYDKDDFYRLMREGKKPDGSDLHPFMPVSVFGEMTDQELDALWLYLESLPPKESEASS